MKFSNMLYHLLMKKVGHSIHSIQLLNGASLKAARHKDKTLSFLHLSKKGNSFPRHTQCMVGTFYLRFGYFFGKCRYKFC